MAQKPALKTSASHGSGDWVWVRGACAILGVFNPTISALTLLFIPLVAFQRWVKAWWIILAAGTAVIVVGVFGGGAWYISPYREIFTALGPGLPAFAGQRWDRWVAAQLPLAIPVALVLAGIINVRRKRLSPTWRQQPKSASERQVRRSLARLDAPKSRRVTPKSLDDLLVTLGVDTNTAAPVQLPARAFGSHCYIDGPSGAGKTTDLLRISEGLVGAAAAQPFRIGLVFITMKPEAEVTEHLRAIG